MKTAAVLVCLALLLAIACSAPVDNPGVQKRSLESRAEAHPHAAEKRAAHELKSLGARVKGNHKLLHDAEFQKEAKRDIGLAKEAVGHMKGAQKKKAAHKVAKENWGKESQGADA
ncbi:uncharacterized protein LOC118422825 [Branchiostoma floridae]|uniref:Uncharacterized protein LOC118422825 n=1 Tax=Branchiostoma floridae TaxID=7739 RepID=A0A9J7N072_BRAFL|nr:uncharacterized protein LOC118422825 [Branchiostoma floridae]